MVWFGFLFFAFVINFIKSTGFSMGESEYALLVYKDKILTDYPTFSAWTAQCYYFKGEFVHTFLNKTLAVFFFSPKNSTPWVPLNGRSF